MIRAQHFLFVTFDGGGNVPPVLGLAKRLSQRGHQVTVLSEPCLEAPVRAYGLTHIPFRKHFTRINRKEDICKDWNAAPFTNPTFDNVVFGPSKIVVEETIAALEKYPTDVLVVDCMMPPALIAGEYTHIPRVVLFHMPEYFPGPNRPPGVLGLLPGKGFWGHLRDKLLGKVFYKILNKYLPMINDIRQSYSLHKLNNLSDLFNQADLRLIQTSKKFDFPIVPSPENVRYTGPVLDDPDWVGNWTDPWPDTDQRPLIIISLSSTFQNQAAVIQNCIYALKGLNVRGLVTLGPCMSSTEFDAPENVKVVNSAPHSILFPKAALVITHAGHGTIMRSLANGLPLVCLPMGRDQKDNSAKVAFHGCGIKLDPSASPAKIRKAVQSILQDRGYKERAMYLQEEITSEAALNTAVTELEQISRQCSNKNIYKTGSTKLLTQEA
jgi:MGT family glycosyltransferase